MKYVVESYKKGAGTAYAELRVLRLIIKYDVLGVFNQQKREANTAPLQNHKRCYR